MANELGLLIKGTTVGPPLLTNQFSQMVTDSSASWA